ncbi:MAG: hypothetical protein ACRCTY_10640, partial [Candidatus Adiutrix sp.]
MGNFLQFSHLADKVLRPMVRALGFMAIGLMVAMVIESLGWTVRLATIAAPLTRRARLPQASAASFTTAIVSNPAANAILSEAIERGEVSPRAAMVTNLLNGSWPSFVTHLPTTMVVAFSFAGKAGLAYTVIMFAAATVRLLGASLLGRFILPPTEPWPKTTQTVGRKKIKDVWPDLRRRLFRRLKLLFSVAVPVYYVVMLIAYLGFFEFVRDFASLHLPNFFLPPEAAALVVFSL